MGGVLHKVGQTLGAQRAAGGRVGVVGVMDCHTADDIGSLIHTVVCKGETHGVKDVMQTHF